MLKIKLSYPFVKINVLSQILFPLVGNKICPGGVARKNPTGIFSALRGNPGFLAALFFAVAKFGIPRGAGQILVDFVLAALRIRSGRIFLLKNPGLYGILPLQPLLYLLYCCHL